MLKVPFHPNGQFSTIDTYSKSIGQNISISPFTVYFKFSNSIALLGTNIKLVP